ncbi:MAG: DUF501 domain-containing protein [Thermoleophilia bacterium]
MKAGASGDVRAGPEVVAAQIGRMPRGEWSVAVSCPFGFPAVIETAPYLDDGTPFPTLFYLTCPTAADEVAGREAAGGVEAFRRSVAGAPELTRAFAALDRLQRRRRRELAFAVESEEATRVADGGAVLERGIGGPRGVERATCLHAYTATLLAATTGALGPVGAGARRDDWRTLLGDVDRLWCRDARCVGFLPGQWERRAAVDVGTNSVRVLIGAVGESGLVLGLVRRAEITQLGAGLAPGKPLDPEARLRTARAVADLVAEARTLGARTIHLVGTSAARDAEDGPAFIAGLGQDLGVAAHVATGPEEAALTFLGVTSDLEGDPVVVDIGGGSTELVRGRGSGGGSRGPAVVAAPEIEGVGLDVEGVDAVSLDLGCVRGTAAWFTSDPPSHEELRVARCACVEAFRPLASRFGSGTPQPPPGGGDAAGIAQGRRKGDSSAAASPERLLRLVGVAGTITTLACVALALPEYDPDAIHLRSFGGRELEDVVDRLSAMGPDERAALPCMQRGRGGVIVAGGVILLAAMDALGWSEVTVSERDLLDGILLSGFG